MNSAAGQRKTEKVLRRWLRFNLAGAAGAAVQIGLLAALTTVCGLNTLAATFLAVESAILHNFAWHQRWTWGDRPSSDPTSLVRRLTRFHLSNGLISIAGNLALVSVMVCHFRLHYLTANLGAIAACSFVNFFVCDQLVFRQSGSRRTESEV
ncbi:MAG: GtrA family protein [Acidobacteria bacterium]|nr:GtrA family protein [Acidobacteriota bacterium]